MFKDADRRLLLVLCIGGIFGTIGIDIFFVRMGLLSVSQTVCSNIVVFLLFGLLALAGNWISKGQ